MSLRVLTPGTFTLLVGAPRPAMRSKGIPVGGPADRQAMALANALLGNPENATALEITLSGPTLRAEAETAIAVVGGAFEIRRDGIRVEPQSAFALLRGETLSIGGSTSGCRCYLAVAGGFQVGAILGSTTAFAPVVPDTILQCETSTCATRTLDVSWVRGVSDVVRCVAGPQREMFDDAFFRLTWQVSPAGNRMGLRLLGEPLAFPKREMVSEPVSPGAVQVTNEGLPIVLGVDGQTIGGYPKVAHVIDADLDRLGQLRPNSAVRFVEVSQAEASALGRDHRRKRHREARILRALSR
jgi:5-oxoprolinase (ATP-hydrolysing) subunit C